MTPIVNTDTNLTKVAPVGKVTMNQREPRQSERYPIKKPSDKPFSEVLANEISYLSPKSSSSLKPQLHNLNHLRIHYTNYL